MGKIKIQEIAEEAGMSNSEMLAKAKEIGLNVKVAGSSITPEQAGELMDYAMTGKLPKRMQPKEPQQKNNTKVTKKSAKPQGNSLKEDSAKEDSAKEDSTKKESVKKTNKIASAKPAANNQPTNDNVVADESSVDAPKTKQKSADIEEPKQKKAKKNPRHRD